jgi:DNA-binding winged helix-turn-helix (wHTH) protein
MAKMATLLRLHSATPFEPFSEASVDVAAPLRPLRLRIGSFELDPKSGELASAHGKVVLQWQPLQLLLMLIDGGGEVVTRAEIQNRLWGEDVTVEFDHSINTSVRKLRRALGDSAKAPSYIETIAHRGYRLKVLVEAVEKQPTRSQGRNDTPLAAGKLPGAWNVPDASEPAASGAAGQFEHGRRGPRCRGRSRQSEEPPDRIMPAMRAFATQRLRQCLISASAAERLEYLRQLLVLVTQALEEYPV